MAMVTTDRDALIEGALEWLEVLERALGATDAETRYARAEALVDAVVRPVLLCVRP